MQTFHTQQTHKEEVIYPVVNLSGFIHHHPFSLAFFYYSIFLYLHSLNVLSPLYHDT
jgi:hypothetical protein